ncbi:hypothetical protein Taro_004789 [Colocasia esculenta]|uniref:Uncharacterized protein n=1 Tax=Colocasia esculenta TaxID=4460 RepID=A0A843TJ51_COLES|nr:hypothetical protein [Colocasia esculenta]
MYACVCLGMNDIDCLGSGRRHLGVKPRPLIQCQRPDMDANTNSGVQRYGRQSLWLACAAELQASETRQANHWGMSPNGSEGCPITLVDPAIYCDKKEAGAKEKASPSPPCCRAHPRTRMKVILEAILQLLGTAQGDLIRRQGPWTPVMSLASIGHAADPESAARDRRLVPLDRTRALGDAVLATSIAQTCVDFPPAFVNSVTWLVTMLAVAFGWSVGYEDLSIFQQLSFLYHLSVGLDVERCQLGNVLRLKAVEEALSLHSLLVHQVFSIPCQSRELGFIFGHSQAPLFQSSEFRSLPFLDMLREVFRIRSFFELGPRELTISSGRFNKLTPRAGVLFKLKCG